MSAIMAIQPPPPGLYEDVPAGTYHKWLGASQSRLLTLRDKSAAHMKWEMDHPADVTPAMALGSAIHTAVLQPELFVRRGLRDIAGDGRTKKVKEARAELRAANPGAVILSPDDYDICIAVRDAVAAHPIARALLDGPAERSAVWFDKDTGVTCKARFDEMPLRVGAITDLKTTTDASPEGFTRAIWRYGYYIQAAHYLAGARTLGIEADFFTVIAVEKEPPYAVAVYHFRDDAIQAGADELKPLLQRYAHCEATDEWPSYPTEAVEISLPPWGWRQVDERTRPL